jgi:hypothetical protein
MPIRSIRVRVPAVRSYAIHTIRAWLGHIMLETTNICAEVDWERKTQVLTHSNALQANTRSRKHWRNDRSLMVFLGALSWKSGIAFPSRFSDIFTLRIRAPLSDSLSSACGAALRR